MEFDAKLLMLSEQRIQAVQVEFVSVIILAKTSSSLQVFFKEIHFPYFCSSLWLTTFSDKQMTGMDLKHMLKTPNKVFLTSLTIFYFLMRLKLLLQNIMTTYKTVHLRLDKESAKTRQSCT